MSGGKKGKWYFGGLASAGAACFTHPLDLLKVQLQTQQEGKTSVLKLTTNIIKNDGLFSLYNGISASLLRQLTYSTARFGIYEVYKRARKDLYVWPSFIDVIGLAEPAKHAENTLPSMILVVKGMDDNPNPPFWKTVVTAGVAGAAGGVVGTPADLVNVRMQNDMKLPADKRRNYKNAIDGLLRVTREEGPTKMFSGLSMATSRAVFMTIGQLSFYDLFKKLLLETNYFTDGPTTHFLSSLMAGGVATTLTQPLDVMKTRAMNAKPGEFKGLMDIFLYTAKLGPLGFFKGYIPAFVRLAPQTILTFLFLEQLKLNFGTLPVTNLEKEK